MGEHAHDAEPDVPVAPSLEAEVERAEAEARRADAEAAARAEPQRRLDELLKPS